jgi:hypothetical protein
MMTMRSSFIYLTGQPWTRRRRRELHDRFVYQKNGLTVVIDYSVVVAVPIGSEAGVWEGAIARCVSDHEGGWIGVNGHWRGICRFRGTDAFD